MVNHEQLFSTALQILEPLYVKQVTFDSCCFQGILANNKQSPEDIDYPDARVYRKVWA